LGQMAVSGFGFLFGDLTIQGLARLEVVQVPLMEFMWPSETISKRSAVLVLAHPLHRLSAAKLRIYGYGSVLRVFASTFSRFRRCRLLPLRLPDL
jgi:hypothetical protein